MQTLTDFEIRDLGPAGLDSFTPLLATYTEKALAALHDRVAPACLGDFLLFRASQILRGKDAHVVAITAEGCPVGLACWTSLAWDTQMFGFPAARLDFLLVQRGATSEIQHHLIAAVLERARKHGIRHLISRVDSSNLEVIDAFEQAGFETIDEIETFSLQPVRRSDMPDFTQDITTRLFAEPDLEQILQIARSSYVFDRFHSDAAIDSRIADRIHEEWMRNSCRGSAADAVVVAAEGSTVLGYATCKADRESRRHLGLGIGSIVLVATAEHARKRGVARACTMAAVRWFQDRGSEAIQVGTQRRNLPAARLYEKCGFRSVASTQILRKVL